MLEILFWVFWIIGLLFVGWRNHADYSLLGGFGLVWFLILLLGIKVFGFPLN